MAPRPSNASNADFALSADLVMATPGISRRATPIQSRDSSRDSSPFSYPVSPSSRKRRRKRAISWFGSTSLRGPLVQWALAWFVVLLMGVGVLRYYVHVGGKQAAEELSTYRRRIRTSLQKNNNNNTTLFTTAATLSSPWTRSDVVHIIHTRFMQRQPDLLELGRARLEIFKTFCLPTMKGQTSKEFLWIIRTDPLLNTTLREELMSALRLFEDNVVVVGSNINPDHFAVSPLDLPSEVWNNYDLLSDYHVAAQTRLVLESRLDADDGLHLEFVRYMRQQSEMFLSGDPTSWSVWCAYSHLEWHYSSPFHDTDPELPEGYLVGIKSETCVTPGITVGYHAHAVQGLPHSVNHQHLHESVPPCPHGNATNCLRRLRDLMPSAIRARTPTSAGMANVLWGQFGSRAGYKRARSQLALQNEVWHGVQNVFRIDKAETTSMRSYLGSKVAEIAADNIKGQCTPGHSCKHSSKAMLKKLTGHPWMRRSKT